MGETVKPPNAMGDHLIYEEFIGRIHQLYSRSNNRHIDISAFIKRIVDEYLYTYRIKSDFELYQLPESLLIGIVNQLTEQEISELARDVAKKDVLKIRLMLNDEFTDTLPLRAARIWLNLSKLNHKYEFVDDRCRITIRHNLGLKYSYLLKEISRYIFEVAFDTRSSFDISDSFLFLTIIVNFSISNIIKDIRRLEIADGLKEILVEAGFTIDLIILYGSQRVSEILNIDNYIGKLIVEAAQNIVGQRDLRLSNCC
ncbi:MAG TPA: hypothetical protein VE130_11555 [Nitrososphaeraceae archaeon]|nr:hypothetical protein [Nitrososphaeraceae archaeon]